MAQIIKINDTRDEALSIFSSGLSEPQLLHYFEPEPGVFFAESPRVISRALDGGYEPMMMICREEELSGETEQVIARCGEMPVYVGSDRVTADVLGFRLIRGAICVMRRRALQQQLRSVGELGVWLCWKTWSTQQMWELFSVRQLPLTWTLFC